MDRSEPAPAECESGDGRGWRVRLHCRGHATCAGVDAPGRVGMAAPADPPALACKANATPATVRAGGVAARIARAGCLRWPQQHGNVYVMPNPLAALVPSLAG